MSDAHLTWALIIAAVIGSAAGVVTWEVTELSITSMTVATVVALLTALSLNPSEQAK